jgi:hypothetical protein
MIRPLGAVAVLLVGAAVCFPASLAAQTQNVPSIRRVQVLRGSPQVAIEIEASDRLVPQTHLITNPDRLIVDFVNAVPGTQLRNQAVHREEVKSLRVGLFSSDPPVTRIVLDLNGPQPYQVFPSGRTVIVRIGAGADAQTAGYRPASAVAPVLVNTNFPAHALPVAATVPSAAKPALEVVFQDGLLSISSNRASLSEILFAVHQRTGAEIAIPAGAEQEKVMIELGPAPAPEVLAHLLNGSKFNFLILSSSTDPHALDQVILSARSEGPITPPSRPAARRQEAREDDEAAAEPKIEQQNPPTQPPAENPNPQANGQAPPVAPPSNDGPD